MPPKAKPGEGIVVVVDVGPGVRTGTDTTFYSQAKKCLINILQRKIFAEKCKDQVGVVLFGTNNTDNDLASADQYQHITVMRAPQLVDWDILDEVDHLPKGDHQGDWLDALVVAMDLLHDPQGDRFISKKIVLLTDFSGEFSDDQTQKIIDGLQNQGIELSVIGPEIIDDSDDDDDIENGDEDAPGPSNGKKNVRNGSIQVSQNWNGKPKTAVQLAGETLVTRIVAEINGIICSFDEAIPQLIFFQKNSAGSANWNTLLDIGPNFQIAITGRIKVKHSTASTWKKMHAQNETADMISEISYHRYDDAQTAVDEEDVILGYKYGTTLVPFSDEDVQMKYKSDSPRGMSVLGFTREGNVSHVRRAGDQVLVVTAREDDDAAAVALSSLIQALAELEMVAITRRVYNKNSTPVMGALFPDITKDYECLIWIPLPYQEDVRQYKFPSLQRVMDKLTDQETQAVDNLINAMDLTCQDEDDEEEFEPRGVLNPQLQHFFNVLTHRAIHPQDLIPAPASHVLKILERSEPVCQNVSRVVSSLKTYFPTKRIVKKTKRDGEDLFSSKDDGVKKSRPDKDDNISAIDLTRNQVTQVTSATPVQDFMALLQGEAPNFNLICKQLGNVVLQLVDNLTGSLGAANAGIMTKVIACLVAFRRESCIIDPSAYNNFVSGLKTTVTSMSLVTLWDQVKEDNLGLINSEENGRSSVGTDEAEEFLRLAEEPEEPAPQPEAHDDDMEDLLDDL